MNMANGEWVTFARVTARVRTCVVTLDQKSATCVSVRNARSEKEGGACPMSMDMYDVRRVG